MAPTLYTLDSGELTTGSVTLGIVHAPGYSLYLVTAHLFTLLPVGDIAFRTNLFSAMCLALTAPLLFCLLCELVEHRLIALSATLTFVWSRYVWATGVVTEVYAPQLLTLTAVGWRLAVLYRRVQVGDPVTIRSVVVVGLLAGIAISMTPSSVLFVPGLIVTFRLLRISWSKSILAGGLSAIVVLASLLYFPYRYRHDPALNMAGSYNANGFFQANDLTTPDGIWWLISGQQFENLFFYHGYVPSSDVLKDTLVWFWGNYLGIGFVVGILGIYALFAHNRALGFVWITFFGPYTYFYTAYGASDRDTMFGPSYLLWAIVLAYGIHWIMGSRPSVRETSVLVLSPLILLMINFPLVDLSRETNIREYAQKMLDSLPPNAHVFGVWWEIVPLEYLQIVEKKRPDLRLYNLFLFEQSDFEKYVASHFDDTVPDTQRPVVVLTQGRRYLNKVQYKFVGLSSNKDVMKSTRGLIGGYQVLQRPRIGIGILR
jgi:hypothetical protein